jgi:hypothetical protein
MPPHTVVHGCIIIAIKVVIPITSIEYGHSDFVICGNKELNAIVTKTLLEVENAGISPSIIGSEPKRKGDTAVINGK